MLRLVYILVFLQSLSHANVKDVVVWERTTQKPFSLNILLRAIELTEKKYGKINLTPSMKLPQSEAQEKIFAGEIHISSMAPTKERMKRLIPIQIPLSRGMLGLRVCLIHKEDKALFQAIRKKSDFKKFGIKFAVGSEWADKEVLLHNGLDILEAESFEDVFKIAVKNKRICFSRSLNEILDEKIQSKSFNLMVESSLLIQYDLPAYFFISSKKPELAKRISEGLHLLREDMEFYRSFWKKFAIAFQSVGIKNRKVIRLEMPHQYVPDEILNDPLLWLPNRLKK
jgi:hypothetical protein